MGMFIINCEINEGFKKYIVLADSTQEALEMLNNKILDETGQHIISLLDIDEYNGKNIVSLA